MCPDASLIMHSDVSVLLIIETNRRRCTYMHEHTRMGMDADIHARTSMYKDACGCTRTDADVLLDISEWMCTYVNKCTQALGRLTGARVRKTSGTRPAKQ